MGNRKHDIERYLRGELSPNEMHTLEKEALNDPFLAEALEGVEQAGADNFLYDLHKLNRTIHDRARRTTRKNNKGIRMWGWTSAVAATILVVAVSGFLVINLLTNQRQREQSMNTSAAPGRDTTERAQAADSPTVVPDTGPPIATLESEKSAINKDEHAPQRKPDQGSHPENPSPGGNNEGEQLPPQVDAVIEDDFLAEDANRGAVENTEREKVGRADESERQPALEKPSPAGDRTVSRASDSPATGAESSRKKHNETHLVPANHTMVKGKVTDEAGQVLPGVNVIVQGTGTGAVTDDEGNYEIAVADDGAKLVFAFIGYESKEIDVREKSEVNVTLEGDIATLSEVVVTGSGFSDKNAREPASFRFAEPNGGRSGFRGYLAKAVKYPQEAIRNKTEGKVTVRFTVEPTGHLTDFKVIKGIGSGCEEELIRAIRQGPYWKPSTKGDQPVRDEVKVRYKFELPK